MKDFTKNILNGTYPFLTKHITIHHLVDYQFDESIGILQDGEYKYWVQIKGKLTWNGKRVSKIKTKGEFVRAVSRLCSILGGNKNIPCFDIQYSKSSYGYEGYEFSYKYNLIDENSYRHVFTIVTAHEYKIPPMQIGCRGAMIGKEETAVGVSAKATKFPNKKSSRKRE
ncbi:MAG: hypothetical protein V1709_00815 [Planctomycetota bacterium]